MSERDSSQDYKLGQLDAKLDSLTTELRNHVSQNVDAHRELRQSVDALIAQVSLARNFLLFLKLIGTTIIFVLAFKFGDIKTLWKAWWGA